MNEQSTEEILQEFQSEQNSQESAAVESPAAQPTPEDWRQSFDWKFKSGDKEVAVDNAEKARTWLSQGHSYSQRMAEFNRRQADWDKQRQETEARYKGYDRYAEIDKYAQTNPDWWKYVEDRYQQRDLGQNGQLPPELEPVINPLLQRLQTTEGILQQWQTAEQERKFKEEDAALDTEIGTIREKYPNIDLDAVDPETGRSLSYRIMKHATDNGLKSFTTAFKDYLHEKLLEDAKASALSQQAKEAEEKAKKGMLGKTQAPTKGLQKSRGGPWNTPDTDAAAILAELGLN
jgi:hypothetical protein